MLCCLPSAKSALQANYYGADMLVLCSQLALCIASLPNLQRLVRAERRELSEVALTAEAAESTLTNAGSLLDSVDFSE